MAISNKEAWELVNHFSYTSKTFSLTISIKKNSNEDPLRSK